MHKTQNVIVSSFSDCREKNGIVTFMGILRSNLPRFAEHRVRIAFANYVDFPASTPPRANAEQLTRASADTPPRARSRVRQFAAAVKQGVKGQLAKRPLMSFLLMMATLSRRGLVTALKARRLEGPDTVHFFQDAFTAYFGQKVLRPDSRKVLLLHSGDDSLRQIFVHFHGMRGTRYETLVRSVFHRLLADLDGIVTLNERYAQALRDEFAGMDVRCIYNTSPFAGQAPPPRRNGVGDGRRLEIVAVGSLQPIKGFDLLVQALGLLEPEDRNRLHVTVVGGGAERTALQAEINAQALQDVITLNGETNDVSPFLSRADAYILPSRDEGFPIALIEACGFGLPIIATRVGAIPEVFNEQACVFMDARAESIREALAGVSRGAVDLQELARRSQEVFDAKLSLDAFLGAYVRLFQDVGRSSHAH